MDKRYNGECYAVFSKFYLETFSSEDEKYAVCFMTGEFNNTSGPSSRAHKLGETHILAEGKNLA